MLSWKQPVVEGLLEGVAIALVFGAYSCLRSCCKRKKQKEWLSKVVRYYLSLILVTDKLRHFDLSLKRASYRKMHEEIFAFLNHKANDFTYKDERDMRNAFRNIDITLERNEIPSMEDYRSLEKNLKEIKWLNL